MLINYQMHRNYRLTTNQFWLISLGSLADVAEESENKELYDGIND